MKPLFEALKERDDAMLSFADGFRDKVRVLFERFDVDKDGRLKLRELAALQAATSSKSKSNSSSESKSLSEEMYVMVCQSLNCHPDEGLSLEALKFTYAADGNSSVDDDYDAVFDDDGNPRELAAAAAVEIPTSSTASSGNGNGKEDEEEEKVYEIGSNGVVDIS
mmetsp:Transcript_1126/g.2656  ORF Transcript_1126/g.2656 Transcript_1126/m.2656 type:complete len:165 (-) Transcript_1126:169-663(-)